MIKKIDNLLGKIPLINRLPIDALWYVFIGGCTTLLNLSAFWLMKKVFGIADDQASAINIINTVSISISILFAYAANKLFVFRSHCATRRELLSEALKFISSRIATLFIEVGGVHLLVNIIGQPPMIGKIETQVIVVIGNFFISKFLVFSKKDKA